MSVDDRPRDGLVLTLAEAVTATGTSESTIRRRLREGAIPGAARDARGGWRLPVAGLLAAKLPVSGPLVEVPSPDAEEDAVEDLDDVRDGQDAEAEDPVGDLLDRVADEVVERLADHLTDGVPAEVAALREQLARAEATAEAAAREVERERAERAREVGREREEATRLREEVGRLRARNDELTGALLREVAGRRPEGPQEHPGTVAVREAIGEEAVDAEVVEDAGEELRPEEVPVAPVVEEPVERPGGPWQAVRGWFRRR